MSNIAINDDHFVVDMREISVGLYALFSELMCAHGRRKDFLLGVQGRICTPKQTLKELNCKFRGWVQWNFKGVNTPLQCTRM